MLLLQTLPQSWKVTVRLSVQVCVGKASFPLHGAGGLNEVRPGKAVLGANIKRAAVDAEARVGGLAGIITL